MNKQKIENIINLPVEERYGYFIRKVAEFEEVWGIYHDNGWAILSDNENRIVVPFWPEEAFAQLCCSEQWEGYTPKLIALPDFIDKWLPGMKKDNRFANIFYIPGTKTGTIISPDILAEDLNEEKKNYL